GKKMNTKIVVLGMSMFLITVGLSFNTVADQQEEDTDKISFIEPPNLNWKIDSINIENILPQSYNTLNNPPNTPSKPSGPTSGIVGYWYLYTTVATDPDGDSISYGWDGGDGIVDYWTGYYPSGTVCSVYIKFLSVGTYKLQIKAKDYHGAESNFSPPLFVTISSSTTNHPPDVPSNPYPRHQATDVDINDYLIWTGGDPDPGDIVTYDVYFGSMLPLQKVAGNISTNFYNPNFLFHGLTYYWFIVAWDNHGLSTQGPLWYFTTKSASNNPPLKPIISGPSTGIIGRSYTYASTTTDPDGDQIYYFFDWDDGTDSSWVGPYNSGDICMESHVWVRPGNYAVKVKAKDINESESVWSDPLPISMPNIHNPHLKNPRIVNMLERFPFIHFLLYP
ncbi:MAG: hypothetical protein QCI00_09735, partial [Candidatus Thermoplasmatota archaeon]|nr:hypothetical protein [Candidatus Thermoplasmatota archaeon]